MDGLGGKGGADGELGGGGGRGHKAVRAKGFLRSDWGDNFPARFPLNWVRTSPDTFPDLATGRN